MMKDKRKKTKDERTLLKIGGPVLPKGEKMTKQEFILELKKNDINIDIVHFGDSHADGYCIRKNYFRWEVSFQERGVEYNNIGFPSESDALVYLLEKLKGLQKKTGRSSKCGPEYRL